MNHQDTDNTPDATDLVSPEDYLKAADVAHYRGAPDHKKTGGAVMDVLRDRLSDADGVVEESQEKGAFIAALETLAVESGDPADVAQNAKDKAADVSVRTSIKKDILGDLIDDATRSVVDQRRQQRVSNGDTLTVPEGVGLDSYLESELEEIVRQRSTDAVDDPIFRWRFSDGVRIETSESVHHDYYTLFQRLASATDKRLVPEMASMEAEDELHEDEDADGDAYARLSLGPESRPWHTQNKLWSRAISGLVQERIRTESVVGPRTDAWESIQARIRTGRAVEDLTDAVNHGMIHVDQDAQEVWIPSTLIDGAIEPIDTTRRAVQAELAERGVTSSELSGARISEPVARGGTAIRFWRIDMTHAESPTPETILEEVEDPTVGIDVSASTADDTTIADGGADTETFGRDPDTDRSDPDDASDDDQLEGDAGDESSTESESDGDSSHAGSDDDPGGGDS